jgi:beta-lactam-binding protein with PASTA domain
MTGRASMSSQPAAASAIDAAGLKADLYSEHQSGSGGAWRSVVSQSPAPGSIVPIGSTVVLTMRSGCPVASLG